MAISKATFLRGNKYFVKYASGLTITLNKNGLLNYGLAVKKVVPVDLTSITADTPWDGHGSSYDLELMIKRGVESIQRVEVGGEKKYKIVYKPDASGVVKTLEDVSANSLWFMGYLKK